MLKVKFSLSKLNRSNLTLVIIKNSKKVKLKIIIVIIKNHNIQKVCVKLQNAYEFITTPLSDKKN
jgi:hypothetical protein